MSILSAENLGVSFGAFDLFRGISLSIANDSKIGLIGSNGVGKTTLLLILAGITQPTTGKVALARGRRIGYLRQEAVDAFADRDNNVYAEMLTVFAGLQEQQDRLNEMEAEMSSGGYTPALLEEYGRLQEAFELAGGYDYDVRIQQTLAGLGLGRAFWETPLNHLSGGQKTRALLARLLLEKPDLLMLDEPTNHLDIEAVEWLERALRDWSGAVLIVSHDRFFLDNTVTTVWEMTPNGIEAYAGNYSAYLLQRQERWEYHERVFDEEKARLLKEVDFIQRNWVRASTHGRALGLLRRLSRDLAIVDTYGILALRSGRSWSEMDLSADRPLDVVEAIRKVNALSLPGSRPPRIKPRLSASHTSGTIILRANQATIGYPGNELFTVRDLELRRGECAALIGPNGSGKTTFLKALLGQIEPLRGSVQLGASLKIGYFAQAQDFPDPEATILDELGRHKSMLPQAGRAYLAQYLFRGDDVYKPVGRLSGGERARLGLAILALEGANFLLLDEPTNHLDIPAREALQEVLENFPGAILLVSHDRYLIDRLATQVWDLRGSRLEVFQGSYREFILRGAASSPGAAGSGSTARQVLLPPKPLVRGDSREERRKIQEMEQLEERIRAQEAAVQRLSGQLQKTTDFERAHQISWQIARAQAALDGLIADWERIAS
ncbi:MAG TPA: ABC-F family ATP-binding cassette domain-containing protein [Anaerolineaceae bacterium]|nr:ABC-F family ATP-binding cassette domain-containing protein [Anaerolineaceae bacterium]